jgi:hypothetical protein
VTFDRATLQAALITLALAFPVGYLVETIFIAGARVLAALEAPAAEDAPVALAAVETAPAIEPPAPDPVDAVDAVPRALVSGTLQTADGTPVRNEIVELESESHPERYAAISDWRGRFSIPGVAVGAAYALQVDSEGRYHELAEVVDVPNDGLQLELVLAPHARANLSGRMVDPDGVAIPNRTLLVEASHEPGYSLLVTGDERGRFRVERAPTGRLSFTTRTLPLFRVRGPLLTPGADAEITLVLDAGEHELGGRLVGERGVPVAGATLKLSWSYRQGDTLASSTRTAVSGPDGDFRFGNLGAGPHLLAVHARGYEQARETFSVYWNSSDVELRLRPMDR